MISRIKAYEESLKLLFFGLLIALISACNLFQFEKPEISQWRGPNRDGIYPETGLLKEWPKEGPELLWKYDSLGVGYASAAVLSDKVIIIGTIDSISYVMAFNHSGKILYKKELGTEWMTNSPGSRSTCLIYKGLGYYQGSLGILYCFNAETGEIKWTKDLFTDFDGKNTQFGITENFVVDEEKIFATPGGEKYNMVALNRFTGDLIWKNKGNGEKSAYGAPNIITIDRIKQLINFTESSLFSVNPENGEIFWRYPLKERILRSNVPVYINGYLFVLAGYSNGLYKLKIAKDGRSVEKIWDNEVPSVGFGDGVIIDGKMYASSSSKEKMLCAVDVITGKIVDSLRLDIPLNVIASEGMIYAYTFKGDFYLLKPEEKGLELISSFHIEGGKPKEHFSHPVIKDGRLYIRHDNSLFVYNIKEKT